MNKPAYEMAWGCPIVVRQALSEVLGTFQPSNCSISYMSYPPHLGTPKLIEQLKTIAFRQSGHRPKHLIVTCGATGAVNAAIYALKTEKTEWVFTGKRHYPLYPSMVGLHDLRMLDSAKKDHFIENYGLLKENHLSLTDSPSNPEGRIFPFEDVDIWDSAYASRTYGKLVGAPKSWKVMCGSLSKTIGLAGIRIGWASTDNYEIANKMGVHVTANNAGLSVLSMKVAEDILSILDLDRFEVRSANYIDSNREEMQRLLNRFGQGNVPSSGMFAIIELGKAERKALQKANIKWQCGSTWGEDENWARLSLGQTREIVRSAVKAALK